MLLSTQDSRQAFPEQKENELEHSYIQWLTNSTPVVLTVPRVIGPSRHLSVRVLIITTLKIDAIE